MKQRKKNQKKPVKGLNQLIITNKGNSNGK